MNQYQPPSSPIRDAVELLGLVAGLVGGFGYWLGTQSVPWISDSLSYSALLLAGQFPFLQNTKFPQLPLIGVAACIAFLVFFALLPAAGPLANLFTRSAIDQQTDRLQKRKRSKRFKAQ